MAPRQRTKGGPQEAEEAAEEYAQEQAQDLERQNVVSNVKSPPIVLCEMQPPTSLVLPPFSGIEYGGNTAWKNLVRPIVAQFYFINVTYLLYFTHHF